MKSFSYHPKVKTKKRLNLNLITPMLDVCRHTAKLYIYLLHKNNSKSVLKENYHSNKFLKYLLVEFRKFFNGILSCIWKVISPKWESIITFIWKSQVFFWKEFINWRILTWISKAVTLAVYFSRSTHTDNFRTYNRNW